ncbi:hypothetical protein PMAYCL1PPCAC_31699, partial [Pristionchus mayeri]
SQSTQPLSAMLRFIILFYLLPLVSSLCPTNFSLVRNGECYRQVQAQLNTYAPTAPANIASTCHSMGALPVIIRNQDDHDYWLSVARNDNAVENVAGYILLGLQCNDESSQWEWTDGSPSHSSPQAMIRI